ncbi:MAG: hypothetical protein EON56_00490 [Alphaproteobacteria bacterium]|nr:MAG: hypothetical protein EON56_00490 [Alphaproteobacteria bacterium]
MEYFATDDLPHTLEALYNSLIRTDMSDFDDEIFAAHLEGIDAALRVIERRAHERAQRKAEVKTMEQKINHGIDTLVAGIKWRSETISELKAYVNFLHNENAQFKVRFASQRDTIFELRDQLRKLTNSD